MPLPASLGRFNRRVTNRVSRHVAGRLPGFAIVIHRGRTTGTEYRTPVNAFRRPGGFEFALTYGMTDWVRNVLHAGGGLVIYRGRTYRISDPELVPGDAEATRVPKPVRMILDALDADQRMLVHADLT